MTGGGVKVLVIPILRRFWLYHAWKEVPVQQQAPKPWQEGAGMQEKASLLLNSLQGRAAKNVKKQWHKFETAPEGTLNNRLFKLAQYVLSKVDPSESFLKALPQTADSMQFMHPSSIPERLVRRRLRLLAAKAKPFHDSRLRLWAAAVLPQLPLIPLPLPNVTIYYTIWRIVSNYSAGRGATALTAAMDLSSDMQRLKLAQQLAALQQQGVKLKQGSWAEQLAADAGRLQQQVDATLASIQPATSTSSSSTHQAAGLQQQQQQPKRLPLPVFIQDARLEELVQPHERLATALPEAAIVQLMELFKQPHLLEHYRAASSKCLGDTAQQQQGPEQQEAGTDKPSQQQRHSSEAAASRAQPPAASMKGGGGV